jgi:hypothetical protein
MCALRQSISSIMLDDAVKDKKAAIDETIAQYVAFVETAVPEEVEKAMRDAVLATAGASGSQDDISKGTTMTDEEKKAAEAKDKELADTQKSLTIAKREIAILKMSDKHQAYMANRGDDMSQDEKDKFADMEPAERDAHMEKHPVKDNEVEKRMNAEIAKRDAEVADLKKRLEAREAADALVGYTKRAVELGIGEAHGVTLQKAYSGDKAALDEITKLLAAAQAQAREGGVFKELGTTASGNTDATPHDAIMAKAHELRKNDPKLTIEQAYAKAYADPANAEIAKRERAQNRPAAA